MQCNSFVCPFFFSPFLINTIIKVCRNTTRCLRLGVTHSSLEGVHLTGEGLHLAPVVISLLLGHSQGLAGARRRLGEVGKLGNVTQIERHGSSVSDHGMKDE